MICGRSEWSGAMDEAILLAAYESSSRGPQEVRDCVKSINLFRRWSKCVSCVCVKLVATYQIHIFFVSIPVLVAENCVCTHFSHSNCCCYWFVWFVTLKQLTAKGLSIHSTRSPYSGCILFITHQTDQFSSKSKSESESQVSPLHFETKKKLFLFVFRSVTGKSVCCFSSEEFFLLVFLSMQNFELND